MSASAIDASAAVLEPGAKSARQPLSQRDRPPLGRIALRTAALAASLLLWQVLASSKLDLGFVIFRNVPQPIEAARAAWTLLHSPKLAAHLGASLARVLAGFLAARWMRRRA